MWDWYNRPGGVSRLRTRTVVIVLVVGAIVTTVIMWLVYSLIAPIIFRPVPPPLPR